MSTSTSITSGGLVTFSIKINGNTIPDEINIVNITIDKAVNTIASAKINILDGNPEAKTFKISSSNTFVPGNTLAIEAGYDNSNALIFKGIITKQNISINDIDGSILEIECRDETIKMSVGRKSLTFSNQKDSDIISSIISTYSGLTAAVSSTTVQWPELVQYYATDWDFILTRAETNGLLITTLNGKVSVFPPDGATSSVLDIEYGNNMLECNVSLNAVTQFNAVKASAWDYKNQTVVSKTVTNNHAGPGNLSSKKLSKVIGLKNYELQTTAPLNAAELTNWCKAELIKSDYSKIQGDVKIQGTKTIEPGKYITLSGLGDRFNGNHLVSKVQHDISNGNWITKASVGISNIWITQEDNDVTAPPASGLLPGIQGVYNATVKKISGDPDNQSRILVDIPLFNPDGDGLWARLSNHYTSTSIFPEIGDEVILGFLNQDPRFPIILGGLQHN